MTQHFPGIVPQPPMSSLLTCYGGDRTAFTTLTPPPQRLSESDLLQRALVSVSLPELYIYFSYGKQIKMK